jgi:hypothetical protein
LGPFEFTRVAGTHNWSVQIPERFNSFFRRPVTRTGGGCRIDSGPRVIHDLYKTALKLAKDVEACDQLDLGDPIYGLEITKSEVGIIIIDGPALAAYRALSGVRSTSVPQGFHYGNWDGKPIYLKPDKYEAAAARLRAVEPEIRERAEKPLPEVPGVRFVRLPTGDLVAGGEILVRMWWGSSKRIDGCRRINKYGDLQFSMEDEDRVVREMLAYQDWLADRATLVADTDTVRRIKLMIEESREDLVLRGATVTLTLPWVEVRSPYVEGWGAFFSPLNWVWCEEKKVWAADVGRCPKETEQWVWVAEAIRILRYCLPERPRSRNPTAS